MTQPPPMDRFEPALETVLQLHNLGWLSWEETVTSGSWEAGPFTYSLEAPTPVRELYEGGVRTFTVQGRTPRPLEE